MSEANNCECNEQLCKTSKTRGRFLCLEIGTNKTRGRFLCLEIGTNIARQRNRPLDLWNEMDRLGARFLISGHTHTCEVLSKENAQAAPYLAAHPSMTAYIDGGITKEDGYIASKLTLTPQSVQIEAADDVGNKVVNETFSW